MPRSLFAMFAAVSAAGWVRARWARPRVVDQVGCHWASQRARAARRSGSREEEAMSSRMYWPAARVRRWSGAGVKETSSVAPSGW